MSIILFVDSAYPLPSSQVPAGVQGLAAYIGGDTPHVWSKAEWDSYPITVQYRLPIFVRSNPPGPGAAADVASAVAQLKAIGAPPGTLVAWDMETAVDAAYIKAAYTALKADGYTMIVYGSQSMVMGNDNPDGLYWGADWTNVPHLHSGDQMTQYVSVQAYDESEASSSLPLWNTRIAPTQQTVEVKVTVPVLQLGDMDQAGRVAFVHRMQALVAVIGNVNNLPLAKSVVVDGDFGPATFAGLAVIQKFFGIPQSGQCDGATWTKLIEA